MSILNTLNKENLWGNIQSQTPFIYKQAGLPEVSWDTILNIISLDVIAGKRMNRGGPHGYGELGFKILNSHRITEIKNEIDELSNYFEVSEDFLNNPMGAHQMYISLSIDETSYGKDHKDPENVFFWQLQGNSKWVIWNKHDLYVEYEFELSPGDFIYCPPKRTHRVIALTPRCGVSLGFGKLRNNFSS